MREMGDLLYLPFSEMQGREKRETKKTNKRSWEEIQRQEQRKNQRAKATLERKEKAREIAGPAERTNRKGERTMTMYQRKLSKEDLKQIEENGGDLYCLFTESQIMGYGVYGACIIEIDDEKYLRYSMGDSCD